MCCKMSYSEAFAAAALGLFPSTRVQCVRNKGGGDCLFWAAAQALRNREMPDPSDVTRLRQLAAQSVDNVMLEQYVECFQALPRELARDEFSFMRNVQTVQDLQQAVLRPDFWGNEMVLDMLVKRLRIVPIVINMDRSVKAEQSLVVWGGKDLLEKVLAAPKDHCMLFLLRSGEHYEMLLVDGRALWRAAQLLPQLATTLACVASLDAAWSATFANTLMQRSGGAFVPATTKESRLPDRPNQPSQPDQPAQPARAGPVTRSHTPASLAPPAPPQFPAQTAVAVTVEARRTRVRNSKPSPFEPPTTTATVKAAPVATRASSSVQHRTTISEPRTVSRAHVPIWSARQAPSPARLYRFNAPPRPPCATKRGREQERITLAPPSKPTRSNSQPGQR